MAKIESPDLHLLNFGFLVKVFMITWKKMVVRYHQIKQNSTRAVKLNILGTYNCFLKKAKSIFANDIHHLNDSAHKLASLKQTYHNMTCFIVEAQLAMGELKMFWEVDSLEGILKLDKFYKVSLVTLDVIGSTSWTTLFFATFIDE